MNFECSPNHEGKQQEVLGLSMELPGEELNGILFTKPSGSRVLLLTEMIRPNHSNSDHRVRRMARIAQLKQKYAELKDIQTIDPLPSTLCVPEDCRKKQLESLLSHLQENVSETRLKSIQKETIPKDLYIPNRYREWMAVDSYTYKAQKYRRKFPIIQFHDDPEKFIITKDYELPLVINSNEVVNQNIVPFSHQPQYLVVLPQNYKESKRWGELINYTKPKPNPVNFDQSCLKNVALEHLPWEELIHFDINKPEHRKIHEEFSEINFHPSLHSLFSSTSTVPEPELIEIQKYTEIKSQSLLNGNLPSFPLGHFEVSYEHIFNLESLNINYDQWHRPKSVLGSVKPSINTKSYEIPKELICKPTGYYQFMKTELLSLYHQPFVLIEYTEQYPLLVQNTGMSSILTRNVRKGEVRSYCGEMGKLKHIGKESFPLLAKGLKQPGLTIIENNLFKAPVFSHQSKDFILLKSNGESMIRKIEWVYTCAQVEPKIQIFNPKSKDFQKFQFKKACHVVAEMIRKKPMFKSELKKFVPGQNLTAILTEIKAFKDLDDKFTVQELPPRNFEMNEENQCSYESAMSYLHRLRKNNIRLVNYDNIKSAFPKIFNDVKDPKIKSIASFIEDELIVAPWILSTNYLKSTTNNIISLQIQGIGDPTYGQCGYSFLKALDKYNKEDYQKDIEEVLKKQVDLLGKAKFAVCEEDESQVYLPESPDHSEYMNFCQELSEKDHLSTLMNRLQKYTSSLPKRKAVKRITKIPNLDGSFIVKTTYTSYTADIEAFMKQDKSPKPLKTKEPREKKYKPKKQYKKLTDEQKLKRKLDRKEMKAQEKKEKESNDKKYILMKFESGAKLFPVGTSDTYCGRCGMKGHNQKNYKLCPMVDPFLPPPDKEPKLKNKNKIKKEEEIKNKLIQGPGIHGKRGRALFQETLNQIRQKYTHESFNKEFNTPYELIHEMKEVYKQDDNDFKAIVEDVQKIMVKNKLIKEEEDFLPVKRERNQTPSGEKKRKPKIVEDGDCLVLEFV